MAKAVRKNPQRVNIVATNAKMVVRVWDVTVAFNSPRNTAVSHERDPSADSRAPPEGGRR